MNLEKLVNIYNTMRQISVNGENVKLMYSCLTSFEEFFNEVQQMQQATINDKVDASEV